MSSSYTGAIAGLGGGGILTLVMIVVGDVVTLKERGTLSMSSFEKNMAMPVSNRESDLPQVNIKAFWVPLLPLRILSDRLWVGYSQKRRAVSRPVSRNCRLRLRPDNIDQSTGRWCFVNQFLVILF